MSLIKIANEQMNLLTEEDQERLIQNEQARMAQAERERQGVSAARSSIGTGLAASAGYGLGNAASGFVGDYLDVASKGTNRALQRNTFGKRMGTIGAGIGAGTALGTGFLQNMRGNEIAQENQSDTERYQDVVNQGGGQYHQYAMDDDRIEAQLDKNTNQVRNATALGSALGSAGALLATRPTSRAGKLRTLAGGGALGAGAGFLGAGSQTTVRPELIAQRSKGLRLDDLTDAYERNGFMERGE